MSRFFKECIDCQIRCSGCDVSCKSYKRDREILDQINEEKQKQQIFSIIPARDKRLPQR